MLGLAVNSMMSKMIFLRFENNKILRSIVTLYSIYVMNNFFISKFSSNNLFHYKSVFRLIFSIFIGLYAVAVTCYKFSRTFYSACISYSVCKSNAFFRTIFPFIPSFKASVSTYIDYFFITYKAFLEKTNSFGYPAFLRKFSISLRATFNRTRSVFNSPSTWRTVPFSIKNIFAYEANSFLHG